VCVCVCVYVRAWKIGEFNKTHSVPFYTIDFSHLTEVRKRLQRVKENSIEHKDAIRT